MELAPSPDEKPVLRFEDAVAFDAWLDEHHDSVDGIWIQIAKASTGITSISWKTAVPVALCHGWIDGQSKRIDDDWYVQKFTPRRARSIWSQINVAHVERLTAEGKMRPWGLAEAERAKADGRWAAAYQASSSRDVPAELQAALDASPKAAAAFALLDSRNRYAMVHRIANAKRVETRERNAAKYVALLERGEQLL
ncbi:MAG: bacteriocin-protection protein [Thermoleophilia bacterium]|nr:bacteriocin-protection protein [Thermoleophilia bacterium]MCZ4496902.1 bacteriocin-protection protein [Thermoleophilia bacterium]